MRFTQINKNTENTKFASQEGPKIYFEISVFSKKFAQFEN